MEIDRRTAATVVTVVIVAMVILWATRDRPEPPRPENLIWTVVEAAQNGDAETYLDCFAGELRAQLDHTVLELTPAGFSDYLRSSSEPLTGVAVYDVEVGDDDRASLTVEYVYRDATERQHMRLELERGGWKIVDLDRSKRAKPLIPYGAPAAPMPEPEPTEEPTENSVPVDQLSNPREGGGR